MQHFGQFTGHQAHGLFLQTAFAEGEFLAAADEQQLAQDFRNNGKVRTFKALGIFAEASVPVLSGIDCLIRVAAQGLKNALSVGLGSEPDRPGCRYVESRRRA